MKVTKWPRALVYAMVLAFFAASAGVVAALILPYAFGLEGDLLYLWVAIALAAGGVVAQVFAAPWFTRWLEERFDARALSTTDLTALGTWTDLLRRAVLEKRVLGGKSQREQMVRARSLMPLQVTQDLNFQPSGSGKPRLRMDGDRKELSQLIRDWSRSPGRLVILGEPGYGKTFAALALIAHIDKSSDDEQVAELFPLVDWHLWSAAHPDTTIEEWLIHELSLTYPQVPTTVCWSLISSGALIPVFDGLDEVPAAARFDCRNALEAYAGREAPKRDFVVTCRSKEYLDLSPEWIGSEHQVALTGLTPSDIAAVIRRDAPSTEPWEEVAAAAEAEDPHLNSLLRNPLHLAAALDVYESGNPRDLLELAPEADAEEQLWDLLLATEEFSYEDSDPRQTRAWLSFLAGSMRSHGRQRLWLHELYLYGDPQDRHRFFLLGATLFMLPAVVDVYLTRAVASWLWGGVMLLLITYLYRRKRDVPLPLPVRRRTSAVNYVKAMPESLLIGLMVSLVWMVAIAPVVASVDIASHLWQGWPLSLEHSVLLGASGALYTGISILALTFGSTMQEEGSFKVADEPPKHLAGHGPGAVIRATRNHAAVATVVGFALLLAINFLVWSDEKALFMVVVGTYTFGWASFETWCFYHWTRWKLARSGHIPRRLRPFLDWAAEETRLLRVGDAYEFRHRTLLEHLARGTSPVGAANVSLNPVARVNSTHRLKLVGLNSAAPEEAKTNVRLGEIGRHRENVAAAQEEARLHPDDAEAAAKLGRVLNRAGDPASALPHLLRAVELDPAKPEHPINSALVLSTLGEDERALQEVEDAMKRCDGGTQQLRRRRKWVLENQRARASSIETAEAVIKVKPDDPLAWWNLARAREQAGMSRDASEARRRAGDQAGGSKQAGLRLATNLAYAGFSAEAVRIAKQTRTSSRDHDRAAVLAQSLADLGDVAASEQHLKRIESLAVNADVLNTLALVLLARGRWGDALLAIQRALENDAKPIAYAFTVAEVKLAAGNLSEARKTLGSALTRARREGAGPGDPTWICRILWQHSTFSRRDLAIEMVIEEYVRHGYLKELVAGLIEGTPTSPDQTGWNPNLLSSWCAEWGRHSGCRLGIGIVQTLASSSSEARNPASA